MGESSYIGTGRSGGIGITQIIVGEDAWANVPIGDGGDSIGTGGGGEGEHGPLHIEAEESSSGDEKNPNKVKRRLTGALKEYDIGDLFKRLGVGFECPEYALDENIDNCDLAGRFDVSPFRLNSLHKEIDADGDGNITPAEFSKCLAVLGMRLRHVGQPGGTPKDASPPTKPDPRVTRTGEGSDFCTSALDSRPTLTSLPEVKERSVSRASGASRERESSRIPEMVWREFLHNAVAGPEDFGLRGFKRIVRFLFLELLLHDHLQEEVLAAHGCGYSFSCIDYDAESIHRTRVVDSLVEGDEISGQHVAVPSSSRHSVHLTSSHRFSRRTSRGFFFENTNASTRDSTSGSAGPPSALVSGQEASAEAATTGSSKENNKRVTWISMSRAGSDMGCRLAMLRIGVKFNLHPLAVESALSLGSEPVTGRMTRYTHKMHDIADLSYDEDAHAAKEGHGEQWYVALPLFRLSHRSEASLLAYEEQLEQNKAIARNKRNSAKKNGAKNKNDNTLGEDSDDQDRGSMMSTFSTPSFIGDGNFLSMVPTGIRDSLRGASSSASAGTFVSSPSTNADAHPIALAAESRSSGLKSRASARVANGQRRTLLDDDHLVPPGPHPNQAVAPNQSFAQSTQGFVNQAGGYARSLVKTVAGFQSQPIHSLQIEVERSSLGLFIAGKPDFDTLISVTTEWQKTRINFKGIDFAPADPEKRSKKRGGRVKAPDSEDEAPKAKGENAKDATDSSVDFSEEAEVRVEEGARSSSSSDTLGEVDEPEEGQEPALSQPVATLNTKPLEQMETAFGSASKKKETKMNAAFSRVPAMLETEYSSVRQGNVDWLAHSVLDACVEKMLPIAQVFEAQLAATSTRLHALEDRLPSSEVKSLILLKRHLEWLESEMRPLTRVLRQMIASAAGSPELQRYVEDAEDNLNGLLMQLAAQSRECLSLKEEHETYVDRRQNRVLYSLTMVTAIFMPLQAFAGYFGMNFQTKDDVDGWIQADPVLQLGTWGLVVFWSTVTLSTFGLLYLVGRQAKWF
ncbi:unnamed protein product [Amoebophrya sp. A25]|nr:unnamed protein product [Amoebophrya sp. A25]|eukprot:GSA25T00001768001.1